MLGGTYMLGRTHRVHVSGYHPLQNPVLHGLEMTTHKYEPYILLKAWQTAQEACLPDNVPGELTLSLQDFCRYSGMRCHILTCNAISSWDLQRTSLR